MEKIIRQFAKERDGRKMIYNFTTFDVVFQKNNKLSAYLADCMAYGRQDRALGCSDSSQFITPAHKIKWEDITRLAREADYHNCKGFQHSKVQKYFMDNDAATIATEVPVWDDYRSGFIDILRIAPDAIQVLDFKPNAHREKTAGAQVWHYCNLLSYAAGIDRKKIEGYYFDDKSVYKIDF
jgi:hypothetical protein